MSIEVTKRFVVLSELVAGRVVAPTVSTEDFEDPLLFAQSVAQTLPFGEAVWLSH